MPDGKLKLQVMNVHGGPIGEPVDVFLKNQTLADAPSFRHVDVTVPVNLPNLNVFPYGNYQLEVDALSYHPVSRFIKIPPDGKGEVAVTLPINPKKVVRVDFPAFGDTRVPAAAWELLGRSRNVIQFEGKTGETLYEEIGDVRRAGFLNLVAKADRTRFEAQSSVLSFIEELMELRGDRFFARTSPALRSATVNSVHDEMFHEASELLHTPPEGYTKARSFKTFDHYGNLQLSFFAGNDGSMAVDMDIDDAQGFEHFFQVVGNVFAGKTHPYNIHEILVATQEIDPGYHLILHMEQGLAQGRG